MPTSYGLNFAIGNVQILGLNLHNPIEKIVSHLWAISFRNIGFNAGLNKYKIKLQLKEIEN
jgi:hypothetical protein